MSYGPKFKCKSEAQKRAIRAYYARKGQGGAEKQAKEKYEREPKCRSYRDLRRDEEARERYFKVMAEDFPNDFLSDDEWDYIEGFFQNPEDD